MFSAIEFGIRATRRLPHVQLTCSTSPEQEFFGKIGMDPVPKRKDEYFFPKEAMMEFMQNFIERYGIKA